MLIMIGSRTFIALVDSGTSSTLVTSKVTQFGCKVDRTNPTTWKTQGGEFTTTNKFLMSDKKLPQFTRRQSLEFKAYQIKKGVKSLYDIILGRDFMQQIGLDLLYRSKQIE